jgi:hypothetical protein
MKRPDSTGGAALAAGLSPAQWAEFLGRHDPVWEMLPDCWEHGAFIGDGLQGALIHLDGEGEARRLIWELGRADVYDPRPLEGGWGRTNRLLIGQFHLATRGAVRDGGLRLCSPQDPPEIKTPISCSPQDPPEIKTPISWLLKAATSRTGDVVTRALASGDG